jgi:hypothetical protein
LNFRRDLRDEEAKAKKEYYDSILPAMEEIENRWKQAVIASPFKAELIQEWGPIFLDKFEMELKTFDPKIMEMRKQEIELQSPFEEGCLESIVGKVSSWLYGVDVAKL